MWIALDHYIVAYIDKACWKGGWTALCQHVTYTVGQVFAFVCVMQRHSALSPAGKQEKDIKIARAVCLSLYDLSQTVFCFYCSSYVHVMLSMDVRSLMSF